MKQLLLITLGIVSLIAVPPTRGDSSDINGDGIADLIFQNNVGQIGVWYMDGYRSASGSDFIYSGGLGDWRVR